MKKVLILSLVLSVWTMQAQMKAPQINFEKKTHNFGEIKESDGPVTYVFKFNNIGSEPLKLTNVRTSCGCTTPQWTKAPILPNGSGEIAVSFNPRNRPGSFRKSITVSTNSNPSTVYLNIEGKVIPRVKTIEEKYPFALGAIRAKKMHVSFFNITKGQVKSYGLEVVNNTKEPATISFPGLPGHLSAETRELAPGEEVSLPITYDASKNDEWGYSTDDIFCVVNGVKTNKPVRISATLTEDFSGLSNKERMNAGKIKLSQRKVDFGKVDRGVVVSKTFTITNTGKSELKIYAIKSTSSLITCKFDKKPLASGESMEATVMLDTQRTRGRQYKTINVISNDPTAPNITYTLSGTVN